MYVGPDEVVMVASLWRVYQGRSTLGAQVSLGNVQPSW